MLKHLRNHAVGYLALIVALGGTSYAASQLPKSSVGKRQLKPGAVTNGKVKRGTLRADRFAPGVLPSPATTPGSTPTAAPTVPPSAPKVTVRTTLVPGASSGVTSATASCEPGEVVTGGGHRRSPLPDNKEDNVVVIGNAPSYDEASGVPTGWTVAVRGRDGVPIGNAPQVFVVCAKY